MTSQEIPAHKPRMGRALRLGISDYYDRIGLMLTSSAIMFLFALVSGIVSSRLVPSLGSIIVFAAGSIGWHLNVYIASKIAENDHPGPEVIRDAFSVSWVPLIKLTLADFLITFAVAFDTFFFLMRPEAPLKAIGVVTAYILVFWLSSCLWHYPFLMRERNSVRIVLKKSFLLTLDNPAFTLACFFATMTGGVLLTVTGIGAVCAVCGVCACMVVRCHRELMIKYGLAIDLPDEVLDEGWPESGGPPHRLNPR